MKQPVRINVSAVVVACLIFFVLMVVAYLNISFNLGRALQFEESTGITVSLTISRSRPQEGNPFPYHETGVYFIEPGTPLFYTLLDLLSGYSFNRVITRDDGSITVRRGQPSVDFTVIQLLALNTSVQLTNRQGANIRVNSNQRRMRNRPTDRLIEEILLLREEMIPFDEWFE